jgi:hypothetical protein
MRPYVSIGRGGPRLGAVFSGREAVRGAGSIVRLLAIIVPALAVLGVFTTNNSLEQWGAVALLVPLMFFAATRKPARPMTAAEKEAEFQAAKAAFNRGEN